MVKAETFPFIATEELIEVGRRQGKVAPFLVRSG